MNSGISFIIIGKNEAVNIGRCVASIYESIEAIGLQTYELIYVDSRSSDHTLRVLDSFPEIQIFNLTGECNAAIARNAGAREATLATLFFIDADMELQPEFFVGIVSPDGSLPYPVVSGWIGDVENGQLTETRYQKKKLPFFARETLDGGIFLIQKTNWDLVGGMHTKYKTGEDGDLGLRLSAREVPFHRVPRLLTLHHTVSYHHHSRMWQMVWDKSIFYWRCILYRDHLGNRNMYGLVWKNDKSLLWLGITFLVGSILPALFIPFIGIYFTAISIRACKQQNIGRVLEFLAYYMVVDLFNILLFFVFHPQAHKVKYEPVLRKVTAP